MGELTLDRTADVMEREKEEGAKAMARKRGKPRERLFRC